MQTCLLFLYNQCLCSKSIHCARLVAGHVYEGQMVSLWHFFQRFLPTLSQPRASDMSDLDQVPQQIYGLDRCASRVPGNAVYKSVASYDQMLAFLVKIRITLAKPSLDNMNYILANQEPLHEVRLAMKRLSENFTRAALACDDAKRCTEEVARRFQQAWDLVDVKANATANQSRYVNNISQEIAEVWRTHTSAPNKHWKIVFASLVYELKVAIENRQRMRWGSEHAEKRAEQWEARYILAVDKWRNTYQDGLHLEEAFTALRTEFLAGQSLAEIFMRETREIGDWISVGSESERVWRIDQALIREEERDTKNYGVMSRFQK